MSKLDERNGNENPSSPSKLRRHSTTTITNDKAPKHRRFLAYLLLNVGILLCGSSMLWLDTLEDHPSTIYQNNNNGTLALLYPPGLTGGYRNQVIRFSALVEYALVHHMTSLYLPSLLWSTKLNHHENMLWDPIPMDWVFDIQHWNAVATTTGRLPILARELNQNAPSCWVAYSEQIHGSMIFQKQSNGIQYYSYEYDHHNNSTVNHLRRASMLQGGPYPLFPNITLSLLTDPQHSQLEQTHQLDHLPTVQSQCAHNNPHIFGGGKKAGRLWNMGIQSKLPDATQSALYQALQPVWNPCDIPHPYTAVHARVELSMLHHPCGIHMEHDLRRIVQQTQAVSNHTDYLFIAVAKDEMTSTDERFSEELRNIGTSNLEYLQLLLEQPNVYECGRRRLDEYYASHPGYLSRGSLLESAINFQTAVRADVFVGVQGSSYSTDILRTRYFLGKRDQNYRYTQTGIERVVGLAPPHKFCKKEKQSH